MELSNRESGNPLLSFFYYISFLADLICILALGMLFVMIGGGIDLSIGSTIALTSVVLGQTLTAFGTENLAASLAIAMMIPLIFAVLNGFFIAKFEMFPFVVTVATQLVIRGAAYLIGNGASVTLVSDKLRAFGTKRLFDMYMRWAATSHRRLPPV